MIDDKSKASPDGNHVAPEGQVYVCAACGKTSRDKYGFQKISRGYDESCMLNAVLCYDNPVDGVWKAVEQAKETALVDAYGHKIANQEKEAI
jgi:hypothetical protein